MGKIYKNGILFAGSTENAKSVAFDNADTGIEATNVQGAIEEIENNVTEINSNFDNLFTFVTTTKQYTLESNKAVSLKMETDVPEGYKKICVAGWQTGSNYVFPLRVTTNTFDIQNVFSGTITATVTLTILCVREF